MDDTNPFMQIVGWLWEERTWTVGALLSLVAIVAGLRTVTKTRSKSVHGDSIGESKVVASGNRGTISVNKHEEHHYHAAPMATSSPQPPSLSAESNELLRLLSIQGTKACLITSLSGNRFVEILDANNCVTNQFDKEFVAERPKRYVEGLESLRQVGLVTPVTPSYPVNLRYEISAGGRAALGHNFSGTPERRLPPGAREIIEGLLVPGRRLHIFMSGSGRDPKFYHPDSGHEDVVGDIQDILRAVDFLADDLEWIERTDESHMTKKVYKLAAGAHEEARRSIQ